MNDAQIERSIGWQILIPPKAGRRVCLEGLSDLTRAYWAAIRQEEVIRTSSMAELHVHAGAFGRNSESGISVYLGRNIPTKGGDDVYALLPPANPRLVLPLGCKTQLLRGLALHRPGSLRGRMAVRILSVLVRMGVTAVLRSKMLVIRGGPIPEFGKQAVLYLGTPDENRKTTVLPANKDEIWKYGTSGVARAALARESEALQRLAATRLSQNIPRWIGFTETHHFTVLRQEYRPGRALGAKDRSQIVRFLAALASLGRESRETEDGKLLGHRCHGDFAAWNISSSERGLFVYDWEASRAWAPAFSDAFYFAVAPSMFIEGRHSLRAVRDEALALAHEVAGLAGLAQDTVTPLWRMWVNHLAAVRPHPFLTALVRSAD